MKLLWRNRLFVIMENYHDGILAAAMDDSNVVLVPYNDPTLIVDPTDGDIAEAEAARNAAADPPPEGGS